MWLLVDNLKRQPYVTLVKLTILFLALWTHSSYNLAILGMLTFILVTLTDFLSKLLFTWETVSDHPYHLPLVHNLTNLTYNFSFEIKSYVKIPLALFFVFQRNLSDN